MRNTVIYWVTTGLLAALCAFAGFGYLSGGTEVVQGFAHVGYPQHLRVLLGIAKLLGGIALVIPGFPTLKEWAYAGFTFTWIAAPVAHYVANDGPRSFTPLVLLGVLAISYVTRPASRRWPARVAST